MPRRRPAAVALVAGALLMSATGVLAGCGQQTGTAEAASTSGAPASGAVAGEEAGEGTSAESGTGAPAPTASPVTGDGQPFPGDTSPDTAEPVSPDGLTVTGVRIGAHDGHDRVVLDVSGQGTPGWDVRYVDAATAEGTGDPVDLAGPGYLRVVLTGTTYPYESGADERARGAVGTQGTTAVTGVFYDGTFEGQSLAYVGTQAERPFRVYALSNPTRVVIEVATD
jgi:hypothetical protein